MKHKIKVRRVFEAQVEIEAQNIAEAVGIADKHVSCANPVWEDGACSAVVSIEASPHSIQPVQKTVFNWNDERYGGDLVETNPHVIEVDGLASDSSNLCVSIGTKDGEIDNPFDALFEVNRLPDTDVDLPCMHVHIDSSNLSFSLFKVNDHFVLRPETGVQVTELVMPNGEQLFRIK